MKVSGIYQIRNIKSNKKYIGRSTDIGRRKNSHLSKLRTGTHYNVILQNAYNKDGESAFEFTILEVIRPEYLFHVEQAYLNYIKSLNDFQKLYYNLCFDARTATKCRGPLSEETKKKISQAHIGKTHSEETKQKLREINTGRILSEETKKKMSKSQRMRKPPTEETLIKMRIAQGGKNNPMFGKTGVNAPYVWKTSY